MLFIIAAYAVSAAALYIESLLRCRRDPVFAAPSDRALFVFLSVTWGLPMTLAGAFAALFLLLRGHRPKRFGSCVTFALPGLRFGLSLGMFIIAPEGDHEIMAHEHGHGIQNIYFGPFTPFCVGLPSVLRYWYRIIKSRTKKPCKTPYDHIWFEKSATESGAAYISKLIKGDKTK